MQYMVQLLRNNGVNSLLYEILVIFQYFHFFFFQTKILRPLNRSRGTFYSLAFIDVAYLPEHY